MTEPWRRTVGLKNLNIGWEPEQRFGRKLLWNKDAIIQIKSSYTINFVPLSPKPWDM